MGMLQYLVTEPMQHGRPALGWYRFWQILHDRTNGALDASYVRAARLWRPAVRLPASPMLPAHASARLMPLLRREGFAALPVTLSGADIAAIKAFAFSTPARGHALDTEVHLSESDIPRHEGRYTWRANDVIRQPVVRRLILDGPFCAIAQDYLGCRPTLVTVSLWLNPPFKGYGANDYHYDNDGPGFLKFFILLTDM